MSDPQNLNNSSPGSFTQPTQPVENTLVPAQTNPPQAANQSSSVAQAVGQQLAGVQAGGSTQATTSMLGDGLNPPTVIPPTQSLSSAAAGGGGGTTIDGLKGAYETASTTAQNIIDLTAALGPVILRDNAVPVATALFSVQDSGATKSYFFVQGTGSTEGAGASGAFDFQTTVTRYFALINSTAATVGVPVQYSPFYSLTAKAWDTDDEVSRDLRFFWGVQPASGATISGDLVWYSKIDSAANVQVMRLSSGGALTTTTSVLTPLVDQSAAGTLSIGITTATAIVMGKSGVTTSFPALAVGTATTAASVAISVQNTTAATGDAQTQNSPLFEMLAHGWSGAADQTAKMAWQMRPGVVGAAVENQLALMGNFNNGAYSDVFYIHNTNGTVYLTQYTNHAYGITFGSSLSFASPSGVHRADAIWPNSNAQTLGEPSVPLRWVGHFQARYSQTQAPTFSATMNLDPSLGEVILVNMTTNLTNWTISNGLANTAGQMINIVFIQDAGGSRLIGTPPASIKWLASTYLGTNHVVPTLTTTGNARDSSWLYWDGTYWVEVYRNFNN